jgi:hypothetical protein
MAVSDCVLWRINLTGFLNLSIRSWQMFGFDPRWMRCPLFSFDDEAIGGFKALWEGFLSDL